MTNAKRAHWSADEAPAHPEDQLVYLSNLIGRDVSLVQPGGGNTSLKTEEDDFLGRPAAALVVKGSGTDLRTITRAGFTHLDRESLLALGRFADLSDEAMSAACRQAILFPDRDPVPSVETLLHAILPARYIAHTHDVATMSLTDTPHPERHIRAAWGDEVAVVDYVRPGFPLARCIAQLDLTPGVRGLVLVKHGLVTWGETAEDCYRTLLELVARAEAVLTPRPLRGTAPPVDLQALLPVLRGELCRRERVVLHVDDSPEIVAKISDPRFPELAARGVATPEHILRAGKRAAIVRSADDVPTMPTGVVSDAVKIVAVPGGALIGAAHSPSGARTAVTCYRAVLEVMENAEGLEQFEFLDDERVLEMELWPLERRKIDGRVRKPLEGRVAVVIGAGGEIGQVTAQRFAAAGAVVVAADRQAPALGALPVVVDVGDERSLAALLEATVRAFGGLDVLFYTEDPMARPHDAEDLPRDEAEQQAQVHRSGVGAATRLAVQVFLQQGIGGRLIYHTVESARTNQVLEMANEMSQHHITANAIAADAGGTPPSHPGHSLITAGAVADAALWLASDAATRITGSVLTVGGNAAALGTGVVALN